MKQIVLSEITDLLKDGKSLLWALLPVTLLMIYVDFSDSHIGFLTLHSLNEYAFQNSLQYMYDSLMIGKLSGVFGYGFYQYGFIYFFLNFLVALPGFLTNNYTWAIIVPRLLTSLFGILLLIFAFRFARLFLSVTPSVLVTACFASLPAFLYGSTWFHPDVPFTCFLVATAYFLARDSWQFGRYYHFAVIALALAITFKYQAITMLPLLGIYVFYDHIRGFRVHDLLSPLRRLFLSLSIVAGFFVLGNPYIFHPMGWRAFSTAFMDNLRLAKEGVGETIDLNTKISYSLGEYYTNIIFLFIAFLGLLWLVWRYFRTPNRSIFSVLAITALLNLGYIMFTLTTSWHMYFFGSVMIGLLALVYFIKDLSKKEQTFILGGVLLAQLAVYGGSYHYQLIELADGSFHPDFNTYTDEQNTKLNDFLITNLNGEVEKNDIVMITPYTPFAFDEIGLSLSHVKVIYLAIDRSLFDPTAYLEGQRKYWGTLKSDEELMKTYYPADYIILAKNIPYIDTTRIPDMLHHAPAYWEATTVVSDLYAGILGFEVLAESDEVVIFKRI